ncbi:cytochrome c [Stieleria sp. JC731]|uniref:cytochrome c n=1 Tax=Pirellulaceae TaxID=2691357 RepID=UPI001E4DE27B|nr:cytochrome c [Stieleria sp. JC731]MCC9599788.1 cytochrome c [Stieleria sp. JC731]
MKALRTIFPVVATLGAVGLLLSGCDSTVQRFPSNRVHQLVVQTSRDVATDAAMTDVQQVVTTWFGTPNAPVWPSDWIENNEGKRLVDLENLKRASGRVYSDKQNRHFGLYTEHCVTCHGIAGGGDGPASLLQNPYPRDFRAGVFKWKSTERNAKPTRQDLQKLLVRGIPGTGMPSFSRVDIDDRNAIVDYLIYLAVRGEFERKLLSDAVDELGYEDTKPDDDADLKALVSITPESVAGGSLPVALEVAQDRLNEIVGDWVDADQKVIPVPEESKFDSLSVDRGTALFHAKAGGVVNCAGCHGPEGDASVTTVDFDDWTKEFTTKLSISPEDRDAVKPFRAAGALRPRQIFPRKLSDGVYRGGAQGEALYRRIVSGIAGTPMPAAPVGSEASEKQLSPQQVWDLVHYVQTLGGVPVPSEGSSSVETNADVPLNRPGDQQAPVKDAPVQDETGAQQ